MSIKFVEIWLLFHVLLGFCGHEACEILAPQPGIKPTTPVLEGKASTTGTPGKSQEIYFLIFTLEQE